MCPAHNIQIGMDLGWQNRYCTRQPKRTAIDSVFEVRTTGRRPQPEKRRPFAFFLGGIVDDVGGVQVGQVKPALVQAL